MIHSALKQTVMQSIPVKNSKLMNDSRKEGNKVGIRKSIVSHSKWNTWSVSMLLLCFFTSKSAFLTLKTFSILYTFNRLTRTAIIQKQYVLYLSLGVSTSRPIEIEIENVLSGRDQFLKLSRFSRPSRLILFWRRDRESRSRPWQKSRL